MAEHPNGGAGGLVKKLLFPASSSGANDAFRSPIVDSGGNAVAAAACPSPRQLSSHHQIVRRDSKPPPRFFSSTHPTAERSQVDNVDGSSRQSNMGNQTKLQQPLATPARVPSSPPLLNRQPVTPSSGMATKAVKSSTTTQRRLFSQSSSMSVQIAAPDNEALQRQLASEEAHDVVAFYANEAGSPSSPSQKKNVRGGHGDGATPPLALDVDDESLQFLKDFKALRRQKLSTSSSASGDLMYAETEVHDNTSSKHYRKEQELQEALVAATKHQSENHTNGSHAPEEPQEVTTSESGTPAGTVLDEAEETGNESKYEIHSYPSDYDNPYHNPLASAMKPNDLFRKHVERDNDTSMNSDINSNASEMGTVIGAPLSLMAERFAELDEMEREGRLAMQNDQEQNLFSPLGHAHDNIFDEEIDPAMANYKAFRANDDDEDEHKASDTNLDSIDESLLGDQFQTPSSAPTAASRLFTEEGEAHLQPTSHAVEPKQSNPEKLAEGFTKHEPAPTSSLISSKHQNDAMDLRTAISKSSPIREPYPDEGALSVVDSEIDHLVRQSASEKLSDGRVRSCSSNNSADVFRTFSTGSARDRRPEKSNQPEQTFIKYPKDALSEDVENLDEELDKIHADPSSTVSSTEGGKRRSNSSLQRALTSAQQRQQDIENGISREQVSKEDAKEEKEEELHEQQSEKPQQQYRFEVPLDVEDILSSEVHTAVNASDVAAVGVGSHSTCLAGALRRIGTNLDKPPSTQYHFDLHDDDEESLDGDSNDRGSHDHYGVSLSAPSSPTSDVQTASYSDNVSLAKIQEAFSQSPGQHTASRSQQEHSKAPESYLLRSPGSSARLMADFRRESQNIGATADTGNNDGQRRSAWRVPSMLSAGSASFGNGPTPRAKGAGPRHDHSNALKSKRAPYGFRLTRGCLSFDTTTDNEFSDQGQPYQGLESSLSFDSRFQHRFPGGKRDPTSALGQSTKFEEKADCDPSGIGRTQALYGSSRSWDISSGLASLKWSAGVERRYPAEDRDSDEKPGPAAVTLDACAFRPAPYVRLHQHKQHPHSQGYNTSSGQRLVSGLRRERLTLTSESSVCRQRTTEQAESLQTPQRIEIEREDALNLLSMLCERGMALHSEQTHSVEGRNLKGREDNAAAAIEDRRDTNGATNARGDGDGRIPVILEAEVVEAAVDVLRDLSMHQAGIGSSPTMSNKSAHRIRMQVLDELLRSHTYANEMKRAALSAAAWLRSIGHNKAKSGCVNIGATGSQVVGEEKGTEGNTKTAAIEVLALKAMLHQAQMEASEKDKLARQLNEELSKCRAEIGRLKSASRSMPSFTSPNRSILDDEDESTTSATEGVARNEFVDNIADQSVLDLNSSLFANQDGAEVVRDSDQPRDRELKMYKSALHDANVIIAKLHSELLEAKPDNEYRTKDAPLIEVAHKEFSVALFDETSSSPQSVADRHPDDRTVNVRMLNGENFVTDWDHLESLPPPPDHGLRSPIIGALLRQWSPDEGLHESLVSWMDKALSGADPSTIPPLTLSSLDHQVRDGFTMHMLPLLLRRPDILVDVKTRAHRKTTYDVAVSVMRNSRSPYVLRHVASTANSVTTSAVTAHVRNGDATSGDHYEVGSTAASFASMSSNYSTLLPHRPRDEKCETSPQHQASIMSALGGALGGLLSRRKPTSERVFDNGIPANSSYDMGSAAGAAGPGPMDFHSPSRGAEHVHVDDEPYHRLVSAPPGRIGIQFVEYRGHAMVSDVSQDSPLLGWIFPSDILIGKPAIVVACAICCLGDLIVSQHSSLHMFARLFSN
jgi:hypothetical protein